MTVFVLTQLEGKVPTPVATVSSERCAKEWFRKTVGNDFYPLGLDQVDHLGLGMAQKQLHRLGEMV